VLRLRGQRWLFYCRENFYKEEVEKVEGEKRVERQVIN
jgi:hypothetical protein